MKEAPKAKIVVRNRSDGKQEISFVDQNTGREVRHGHITDSKEQTDREVRQLKNCLERAGNHVTFKEM